MSLTKADERYLAALDRAISWLGNGKPTAQKEELILSCAERLYRQLPSNLRTRPCAEIMPLGSEYLLCSLPFGHGGDHETRTMRW